MSEAVLELFRKHVGARHPFRAERLSAGSAPSKTTFAWGCPTRGDDTEWATYDDGDRVLIKYKKWYGTHLGDTDTHVRRFVAIDGAIVLDQVD